jgi:outer membrane lipoprotein SlyB
MPSPLTIDSQWVRQAFLVSQDQLEAVDQQNRTFSTAQIKFTDASLGGNICINPPPQFTRYADLRPANKSRNSNSSGMGRYYSEAIDDHNQIIYMRFGQPAFNSMTNFFSGFYNSDSGSLARTGRSPGLFYAIGRAGTFVVSLLSWKLLAVHLLGFGLSLLRDKPNSKYYYMKPAMPLYWNAVQTIVNQIAVNKGIVPRVGGNPAQSVMNQQYQFSQADIDKLHQQFPAMFASSGSIDVYAMATRAQRMVRAQEKALLQTFDDSDNADIASNIQRIYSQQMQVPGADFQTYLNSWLSSEAAQPAGTAAGSSDAQIGAAVSNAANDGGAAAPPASDSSIENLDQMTNPSNPVSAFMNFLKGELDDGGAFASFRVDHTGSVAESFSNQVGESEIQQKINNVASSSRSTSFNFMNGNVVGGALGSMASAAFGAVGDLVKGVTDQLQLSGLAVLGGAAFVDIPKVWQSSAASLPRASYTIQLRSPYGNPFSQLMNIYIPLAMLLAGSLPLSSGKQSYCSPFLVELYDKGRCQTRLGMIDQLSITRGVGNTGWNADGECLGMEVTFSVVDMSSVMHMPITAGFNFNTAVNTATGAVAGAIGGGGVGGVIGSLGGPAGTLVGGAGGAVAGAALGAAAAAGVFDEDTVFTDYMNVLGSVGLADQIYQMRRFKRNLTQKLVAFDSWKSPSHMASFVGDMWPSRIVSAFYRGTVR